MNPSAGEPPRRPVTFRQCDEIEGASTRAVAIDEDAISSVRPMRYMDDHSVAIKLRLNAVATQ